MAGERKQQNEQMEVVAALWVAGGISGAARQGAAADVAELGR